ncbi:MAG: hypothetical protein ABIY70_28425 [Capsulimonas sp.]|uniref:hypothetical protein n=1 Tax=Capsulimonas sp. TaxID=2494211 RepID=UPI003264511D
MNGPTLELNFYRDENEHDFLIDLIEVLIKNGAVLSGKALVHRGPNIRQKPFSFASDEDREEIEIASVDDLRAINAAQDLRLVQIPITNASGISRNSPELAGIVGISDIAAAKGAHHPVAIWASGDQISLPTPQSRALSTSAYQRFIRIVEKLAPDYAAITLEWSLECPMDLQNDPNTPAFMDFYLSSCFFDASLITEVMNLCSHGFIKPLSTGVYISNSGFFSPNPLEKSKEQIELSTKIGKLIATYTRLHTY